jgi:agmatine/peptidylarginine deiminase
MSQEDEADEHYFELKKMEEQLKGFTDLHNQPFKLIPLPMPKPIFDESGERLPATYANFLIINGAVLMPIYNDEKDKVALERIRAYFPDREVIGIDCNALILQHGSLHCVTMQYPKEIRF